MDYVPLSEIERENLLRALRGNAEKGTTILMDRRDTSFAGTASIVPDDDVINAIRSVPVHY